MEFTNDLNAAYYILGKAHGGIVSILISNETPQQKIDALEQLNMALFKDTSRLLFKSKDDPTPAT